MHTFICTYYVTFGQIATLTYSGCFSASASRSASGSVARMTVLPFASAVFIDRSWWFKTQMVTEHNHNKISSAARNKQGKCISLRLLTGIPLDMLHLFIPKCPETETLRTELLQQNVFTGEMLFATWLFGLVVKALHTALTDRLK